MENKKIKEWQELFVGAVKNKFGESSPEKRFSFIQQELYDILISLEVKKGNLKSNNHRYDNPSERIAGLLANVFVLADQQGADLDKELQKALDWFLDPNTRPSSE